MQRLTRPAKIAAAGVLASLAALALYAEWLPEPTAVSRPVDRARFKIAEQANIRADLLDPDSTTFRNEHVSLMRRVPILCEVNTRATAGGYEGFQRFVSGATVRLYERDIGRLAMDRIWQALCDENHRSGAAAR